MARPWFSLQQCEERFFDGAPVRDILVFDIAAPAERVWAELTSDSPLSWCRALEISWTSPRPFGVGTTRTARVWKGTMIIRERFMRWEEGRRKSFYVLEASAPLFRRFGEDYIVEETSPGNCRFTWTLAAEPTAIGRLARPIYNTLVRSFNRDTRQHFGAR